MRKQEKVGYGMVAVAVLLTLGGSIGFVMDGEVNDIPTPNAPERTFFGDEPLPENGLSTFISARLTLTWDRDDIYVVIVDEDEKKTCEAPPPGLLNQGSTTACTPYDADVRAAGGRASLEGGGQLGQSVAERGRVRRAHRRLQRPRRAPLRLYTLGS